MQDMSTMLKAWQNLTSKSLKDRESGFFTTNELANKLKLNKYSVMTMLRNLNEAGLLEVGRVMKTNIMGAVRPEPGYRVKAKKQANKK